MQDSSKPAVSGFRRYLDLGQGRLHCLCKRFDYIIFIPLPFLIAWATYSFIDELVFTTNVEFICDVETIKDNTNKGIFACDWVYDATPRTRNSDPLVAIPAEIKSRYVWGVSFVMACVLGVGVAVYCWVVVWRFLGRTQTLFLISLTLALLLWGINSPHFESPGFSNRITKELYWPATKHVVTNADGRPSLYQYMKHRLRWGHLVLAVVAISLTLAFAAITSRSEVENHRLNAAQLAARFEQLHTLLLAGAMALVMAIVTSKAFVSLPLSTIDAVAYEDLIAKGRTLGTGVVIYWSTLLTVFLASAYLLPASRLNAMTAAVVPPHVLLVDRATWLEKAGLRSSIGAQVRRFLLALSPLIAGSFDELPSAALGF